MCSAAKTNLCPPVSEALPLIECKSMRLSGCRDRLKFKAFQYFVKIERRIGVTIVCLSLICEELDAMQERSFAEGLEVSNKTSLKGQISHRRTASVFSGQNCS